MRLTHRFISLAFGVEEVEEGNIRRHASKRFVNLRVRRLRGGIPDVAEDVPSGEQGGDTENDESERVLLANVDGNQELVESRLDEGEQVETKRLEMKLLCLDVGREFRGRIVEGSGRRWICAREGEIDDLRLMTRSEAHARTRSRCSDESSSNPSTRTCRNRVRGEEGKKRFEMSTSCRVVGIVRNPDLKSRWANLLVDRGFVEDSFDKLSNVVCACGKKSKDRLVKVAR